MESLEARVLLTADTAWTISATANDHNTTSAYSSNPALVAENLPLGQSYQADLYENWDPNVQDAAQTDIVTYHMGSDAEFFYFRFKLRGAVTGDESTVYHIEVEADSDDAGGDARADYFVAYSPSNNDDGTAWRSANLTELRVHRDADNTVGGSNLAAPDGGDPTGYEAEVAFNKDTDVFGRIFDGVNSGWVDIAVKRTVFGQSATSTISSRGTTKQDGNIDKSKLFFHDRNTSSDLTTNRIDNTSFLGFEEDPEAAFTIDKTGDEFGKATDRATYTVTIVNTGEVDLYPDTITDSLVGLLSAGDFIEDDTDDNVLEVGETWTLEYGRTVEATDPDPLLNEVEAVFNTTVALDGDEVTQSDDHTVDLFAPNVQIVKTADKIVALPGDTVKYTFTITNLTDGDLTTMALDGAAPDLILATISDDVLGDLSSYAITAGLDELALNESGSFDVNYVVLASDPSPLTNTVDVLYNPDGFDNEITDEDSHTLAVVDAAISLTPGTATNGIGETHTFTATVTLTGGVLADGGASVDAAIDSGPGSLSGVPGSTDGDGTTTGELEFTLVSNTTGTTVVSASAVIGIDVTGDGVADITLNRATDGSTTDTGLENSEPAEKTWIDGALRWLKHNHIGGLLGGASFEIRRTHDRLGTNLIPDDPIMTVVDNGANDADPTAGEIQVNGLPLGRYEIKETIAPTGWNLDTSIEVVHLTLLNPSNADSTTGDIVPIFVNTPTLGGGGGHTLGFWSNKNGEQKLKDNGSLEPELSLLRSLNLKNANGTNFDPLYYNNKNDQARSLRPWLLNGNSTNMSYMLSVQLAAMALNVEAGFVNGGALTFAPQLLSFAPISGLDVLGRISISNLMIAADGALAADGYTPSGDANRAKQNALKTALDDANNNLNFVI